MYDILFMELKRTNMRTNDYDPEYPEDIKEDFELDSMAENSKAPKLAKEAIDRFKKEFVVNQISRREYDYHDTLKQIKPDKTS